MKFLATLCAAAGILATINHALAAPLAVGPNGEGIANPAFRNAVVPDGSLSIAKTSGLQPALDAKAGIAGQGIVDPTAFLKATKSVGSVRLTEGNKAALSRWWAARERRNLQFGGNNDSSRLRVVDLGDSTTAPLGSALQRRLGFGGETAGHIAGIDTAVGTTTYDQWTRAPQGAVRTLTNGQVFTISPRGPMTAVWVSYLAKSGNGSIQLSYQPNKTGGYTTSTQNWKVEEKTRLAYRASGSTAIYPTDITGLQAGMTVTGTGIPGATMISSVNPDITVSTTGTTVSASANVTLASVAGLVIGMRVDSMTGQGLFINSINVGTGVVTLSDLIATSGSGVSFSFRGATVILSAAATTTDTTSFLVFGRSDSGSSTGGTGTLATNNSGAEKFCTAIVPVPNSALGGDFYNIKLTVTGTVDLCAVGSENGGLGIAYDSNSSAPGAVLATDFGEGGKLISTHFNTTSADLFARSLGWMNPEIISFKGLNDWNLPSIATDIGGGVTVWSQYAAKLRAAAPNALFMVFSSHVTNAYPSPDNPVYGYVQMDDWMRNWCANSGYAVFVDARQNYETQDQLPGSLANLTSDGLHQYGTGGDLRGGGEYWNTALAINLLLPVLENTGIYSTRKSSSNSVRTLPGSPNRIQLYQNDSVYDTKFPFHFDIPSRSAGSVMLRTADSPASASTDAGGLLVSGIHMRPTGGSTGTSPGSVSIVSSGNFVMAFGCNHFSGNAPFGALIGSWSPNAPTAARVSNGWRFIQPVTTYGQKDGLIAESRAGNTSRTLGVSSGAAEATEGTDVFGWYGETGNYTAPKTIIAPGITSTPQTINKITGRVNFAASAASIVVNNSLVTVNSNITVTKTTNDSTARLGAAVPGAGFFTIYMDVAPVAECAVTFKVSN